MFFSIQSPEGITARVNGEPMQSPIGRGEISLRKGKGEGKRGQEKDGGESKDKGKGKWFAQRCVSKGIAGPAQCQ